MRRKGGWFQRLVFVILLVFLSGWEHAGAEICFFVEREEDDEKEGADSSRDKQLQTADSSG